METRVSGSRVEMMESTVYRLSPLMLYEAHLSEDPGFKKKEFQARNISIVHDIWHLFFENKKFLDVYPEIP